MKSLLLALSLACLAITGFTQESEKYKKAKAKKKYEEGYVTDNLGNTFTGLIVDSDGKPAERVSILVPSGEKLKFDPIEVKEYGSGFYRFISTREQFLQVIFENKKVGIYKDIDIVREYRHQSPGSMNNLYTPVREVEKLYIHRPGEPNFKKITKIVFAKSMSEYFIDCPVLSEKIKNKEYRAREDDLHEIVSFYDHECTPTDK
ncbi:hypothetical protein KK062_29140 [Fulvivirgaceae bacterium PWU5]|uniref:Uncharacterized protein n=1 Tax=Dawidia cretensis TaxID=2782350 RepID=A0AAP2E4V5_9BACT|nr:hypothetical protein [Dawidia cretensis]MBT1712344.1 hypothetical protein [Dawidia cretensis]